MSLTRDLVGEVPDGWTVEPLGNFVERITYGFTNPMPTTVEGPYMITAKDIHDGAIDYSTARHTSVEAYSTLLTEKSRPRIGDVLLTKDGSIGRVAVVDRKSVCINQSVATMRPNNRIGSQFLAYLLQAPHYQRLMENDSDGSTIKHIYITRVDKMNIAVPSIGEQRAIAEVLGALDGKIAANRKLVGAIRELTALEFESAARDGVRTAVADLAEFHNRRRVPLSASQRDEMNGDIPYYGATGRFGTVDRAIFDEILVLVGEDGSVVNEDGSPVTQYVWGPAWVNNHAHVLTGRGISSEILLLALEQSNVVPLVTGAVQAKISMGNLKKLELRVPQESAAVELDRKIQPLFAMRRELVAESGTLTTLRDTLLPRLMSGELRVRDAEREVEAAL
ncbi:restriction endonuclease subunit S [Rhodococcus sp. NPDC058532]|uniref:restriction endonuclease subunit S n=1 Tax=Rhodococcus sp. NPDC058532 TaxID=3346540 RepID=UPI003662931B